MTIKRINSKEMGFETPWEISLRKCQNGYVISQVDELDEGIYKMIETVCEDGCGIENLCLPESMLSADGIDEKVALYNALWHVVDYFAEEYSKHNKVNISIQLEENKDEQ